MEMLRGLGVNTNVHSDNGKSYLDPAIPENKRRVRSPHPFGFQDRAHCKEPSSPTGPRQTLVPPGLPTAEPGTHP